MNRKAAFRELKAIYSDLEGEHRPVCVRTGRCCRFGEFGHQLWMTRLEVEYLLERAGLPEGGDEGVCPFLKGGECAVRDRRMLGCRIYFCDASYTSVMTQLYEKYHRRIREAHRRHGVPYAYSEYLGELRRRRGEGK